MGARVARARRFPEVRASTAARPDPRLSARGYQRLQCGTSMQVMGLVTVAGVSRVALITERPDRKAQPAPAAQ